MDANIRQRVLVAGSGVAGLETLVGLKRVAEDRFELELLCPMRMLNYRALRVAEPFTAGATPRVDVNALLGEVGAVHRPGALTRVDPEQKIVLTSRGQRLRYDTLVIATGAARVPAVPGALTFSAPRDVAPLRRLLVELEQGRIASIAFVVPSGAGWALPAYELALLTAAWAKRHREDVVELTLVTPESEPLVLFGDSASRRVGGLLGKAGIEFLSASYPVRFEQGQLELSPSQRVEVDAVVALPRIEGSRILGLPSDAYGFVPTDPHGLVPGVPDVYAAGDATTFPIKQGGIAAQQADAVVQAIAARAGALVEARPFRPALKALLLTGGDPEFLQAELIGGKGEASIASTEALWFPPRKIATAELGPYLPRAPFPEAS